MAVYTKLERMACWRVVVWAAVEVEACVVRVSVNHVLPCEIHLLYVSLPRKRRWPPSHLLSMVNCLFWWYEGCSESNAQHFFFLGNYLFRMYEIHGDRGSTVVKVLCYKSEGRWFDCFLAEFCMNWKYDFSRLKMCSRSASLPLCA